MATVRRNTRRGEAQMVFEAITIEGGILSPEWLSKVAQLKASQQEPEAYHTPKGTNLRDELGRYWRIARAHWHEFNAGRAAKGDPKALSERFITTLLREVFGFTTLLAVTEQELSGRPFRIGYAALGLRVPIVISDAELGLEKADDRFGDGTRRRSAFGLAQEYLNAADGAMWGLCTDGLELRVVRDNASLTRPAWLAADLQRIFTEDRYADFTALWLVLHESRFGRVSPSPRGGEGRGEGVQPADCALEAWRTAGREEGTLARDKLRFGVEDALKALGQGFLEHSENTALREALRSNALTKEAYFQQLLRLVYRLIFIVTAEERQALHPREATTEAKALYAEGYGLRRLRERAVRRSAFDRFADLWEGLQIVFSGLERGQPLLGLPALAGIFEGSQCAHLDASRIENHRLLTAISRLTWIREDTGLSRVNWRDMGPEELGSVYESLLELVPQLADSGREFTFASPDESRGNARKTSGSYYTPDSLVQVLLDSALEPVVAQTLAANPKDPVAALLSLSVVDPACGSGHFLLAAARRLAWHVARLRVNGTPSVDEFRHAVREVVGRCIFGVDLNPMAVELCKVALWMEALEPGRPLSFLDSHIQQGNALLGTTPELMKKGIPDEAWSPLDGDDKKTAAALKKRNKSERNQKGFKLETATDEVSALTNAVASLDAASDADVVALAKKQTEWTGLLGSVAYQHQKLVADAWCAAFVWPKDALPNALAEAAPTNETWRQLRDEPARAPMLTVSTVHSLARDYEFLHWHLQFPQVFAKGGFDVVLGNPPWESLRVLEKEFFANSRPQIADAATSAARKKLIAALRTEAPVLFASYQRALRSSEGVNALVVGSGRYPLCAVGRINLFALFAETARALATRNGRVGQILPSGIVTDDSTKLFFQALVEGHELASLFHFENEEKIFPGVHHAFRFVLLVVDRASLRMQADIQCFSRRVSDLSDADRRFTLSAEDIALLNPATKTCPIFRTRRDATLTSSIYRRVPVLAASAWRIKLKFPLDVGRESSAFSDEHRDGLLPLYEGKYFHQFEHRWVTNAGADDRELDDAEHADPNYSIRPRHWFPRTATRSRFADEWNHEWVLAWRDITGTEKQRTFIAAALPSLAVAHSAWLLFLDPAELGHTPALLANINSYALDYVARQKVGGTHMSAFIVEQLPLLPPTTYEQEALWTKNTTVGDWLRRRVLELTYTAWDLEPFAREVGYDGPPFRLDPERRFLLRCELDAAFFHLYGLSRDDAAYILDTFPIVKKNDEKTHKGDFRTKRVILERYDALDAASQSGQAYVTPLSPPPADPAVAHPERGGKVVPLRPAVRPQPEVGPVAAIAVLPDLAAVSPNDWARTHTQERGEVSAAIVAVLKAHGASMDRREARLAALLCLEPHLLMSHLDKTERSLWSRAIGDDARKTAKAGIDATTIEWGEALSGLRGRGRLLEDLEANTWTLGRSADASETGGWPDGRAGFVVNVLRRLQASTKVAAVILKLPTNIRQWLAHAA